MSLGGLFGVGTSALNAAYMQLQTTGHNIANVNTPGYSRQEVVLGSAGANGTGAGFIGRGVEVATVKRRYDQFLNAEVTATTAAAAGDKTRATQLARLDDMLANTDVGIGAALDDLTASFADVVNRPFDASARNVVQRRVETVVERIGSVSAGLDNMLEDVDQRLQQAVETTNNQLRTLADLNNLIAKASGSGQTPNDLLDRRDALVEEISGTIQASAFHYPDGTVSLFAASGQALLVGGAVADLSLSPSPDDASKLRLVVTTNGRDVPMRTEMLGGGTIGGLLKFRDEDLDAARFRLGQLAASVAWTYNRQQSLGRDANGQVGEPMFGFAQPRVTENSGNVGDAEFSAAITDGTVLAASDYQITFNGSAYLVKRLSDDTETTVSSWPATIDGLTLDLTSGTAQAGDRFLVRAASEYARHFTTELASGQRLATGYAVTTTQGATNAGDVSVREFAVESNDTNLTAPVTITFDGAGNFSVSGTGTGNPTGLAYTAGMTISYNGWSMELRGVPAAGDTIQVVPTPDPAVDNRNARALLELADKPLVDGYSYNSAFSQLLSDIGVRTQAAQASASLSEQVLADARSARAEVSGVNLDEEAARLLQYQQAYQAAAKLMATAQSMFDTVMQMSN